jgi:hypothetical protein
MASEPDYRELVEAAFGTYAGGNRYDHVARYAFRAGLRAAAEEWDLGTPAGCVECPGCDDCNPVYRLAYIQAKMKRLIDGA